MRSTTSVLASGDYGSAGALARKALECVYALALIAKRGREGLSLIEMAATRRYAGGLQENIPRLEELENYGIHADREAILERLRKSKGAIPNGDTSPIDVKKVAAWADLSHVHANTYENLNSYAHFDLVHANEAASVGPMADAMRSRRLVEVALSCQEIAIEALVAIALMGSKPAADAATLERSMHRESAGVLAPIYLRMTHLIVCSRGS